jgi:dienelactone hydrolase
MPEYREKLSRRELISLATAATMSTAVGTASAQSGSATLAPGTTAWQPPSDIAAEQFREMRTFLERQIARCGQSRQVGTRDQFRHIIGAIDPLQAPQPKVEAIGADGVCTADLVSWPILKLGNLAPTASGPAQAVVHERAILLKPHGRGPFPAVIAIPDADQSAADITGLSSAGAAVAYARELVRAGHVVLAPFCVQRRAFTEPWSDDRSWLFRLAYMSGRHIIGSDVQQVFSALDYLSRLSEVDPKRIAAAGVGQGGLTALYAAVLDERIASALVSGYFDSRERAYDEPEDRMVWSQLLHFGDAEFASLIAPRKLILLDDDPERLQRARSEVAKMPHRDHVEIRLNQSIAQAMDAVPAEPDPGSQLRLDSMKIAAIANHQFVEWQARFRNLATECYRVRESKWQVDTGSIESYRRSVRPHLQEYLDLLGRYPAASGPLNPKSVKIYDEAGFTGFRLQVRVYDDVSVCGILLIPKSANTGKRRPVVFAVHGFSDRPEDVVVRDRLYHKFAARLADRGYVVFAPMIGVQDGAERSGLVRRSHLIGCTPVGLELVKLGRAIDFLSTLPFVDPDRFAIYGLSYGGYTALRVGAGEPRFRAVISSGDFNETTIKNTDLTEGTSFLFHGPVLDRYIFGWLNSFSDSVLARLIAPRAYMTEMGDSDSVIIEPRRFLEIDIAAYLDVYRRLGIPERAGVARFAGPHEVNTLDTFSFLDRVLGWKA